MASDSETATVIAFVSQKGGVGKSTLARGLAREAAKSGLSVKIADLDTQQGTCVEWHRRRLNEGVEPVVSVEAYKLSSLWRPIKRQTKRFLRLRFTTCLSLMLPRERAKERRR